MSEEVWEADPTEEEAAEPTTYYRNVDEFVREFLLQRLPAHPLRLRHRP
jgi:hypothetical protein